MTKLDNKVALITGAGRGIGQETAIKLASEGARIVVNDLDTGPAEETVEKIQQVGGEAVLCVGNVIKPDFAERFISTALDNFGGIDIIINNAGFVWDNVVQKMTDESWQTMIDIHLTAPFRILRSASSFIRESAKKEREQGKEVFRKVVNISSIAGICGNPGQIAYSSAKAGIVGMTLTMCKEWARYRVNVNCVAFGPMESRLVTPITGDDASIEYEGRDIPIGIHPDNLAIMEKLMPLGRAGTLAEAAGAIYLLCIPESNYVSGHTLVCSGGFRT